MRLLGIDIGGTFTDTVLVDGDDIHAVKTATSSDLISGLREGIERACDQAGIEPADVDVLSHGSTIAVNALIEEEGAKTALVTTEGFRDVLEIGEGFRDASLLYDPCGDHQAPLIPRRRRFGVRERIDARGAVRTPLDRTDLDRVVDEIRRRDVEAVAVTCLNSYRNAQHERAIAEHIERRAEGVDISISADVSPEIREYSRSSTTVVDAYIKPRVSSYLTELEAELDALGVETTINIMKSDGGLARPMIAADRPVTQIISGPVAGVKAAQFIGSAIGIDDVLTLDMGGTSCDTAMIQNGSPIEVPYREVHGLKINGPFTNINTVGAGGGSIARLDEVGALRVGPESAGAEPGPVCYDRGGTQPTVTDADLLIGLLNPDNFAGGTMELDVDSARVALREHIAAPLDMSLEAAALSVRDIIDSKMASAIRVVSVNQGLDPREFTLMGFGGAGPMHACNVAVELGIERVVFPNNPGVHSSFGLLVSDIHHRYTRSLVETVDDIDVDETTEAITQLIDRGTEELAAEGVESEDRQFSVTFDMMYSGQAHYLTIPMDGLELTQDRLETLVRSFETEHEEQYGFVDDENPVELVNVRVRASGDVVDPDLKHSVEADPEPVGDARLGHREVVFEPDRTIESPYYDWYQLHPGHELEGPALVELENSMIWLPPDFDGRIDQYNNMIATRRAGT